jgi:hypothetical protein
MDQATNWSPSVTLRRKSGRRPSDIAIIRRKMARRNRPASQPARR